MRTKPAIVFMALYTACNGPRVPDDSDTDCPTRWEDRDGDGHGDPSADATCEANGVATSGDCDDRDATTHPGAEETCDGVDQDCDGTIDEDPIDPSTFWHDADGDGWGDGDTPAEACSAPADHVTRSGDCDDTDTFTYPGAAEIAGNGLDDDCDGFEACYTDADGDGYGGGTQSADDLDCLDSGEAALSGDCDDNDANRSPAMVEVCGNGIDEDCVDNCGIRGELAPPSAWATLTGDSSEPIATCGTLGDHDGDGHSAIYLRNGASLHVFDDLSSAVVSLADADFSMKVGSVTGFGQHDALVGDLDEDFIPEVSFYDVDDAWYVSVAEGFPTLDDAVLLHILSPDTALTGLDRGPASDLDGNGHGDLAIAGAEYAGVFLGPSSGVRSLDNAEILIRSEVGIDLAAITTEGDVSGDGNPDLLVSAPMWAEGSGTDQGSVYVFSEPTPGSYSVADASAMLRGPGSSRAGALVASPGDVTGDGYGDLVAAGEAYYTWIVEGPVSDGDYLNVDTTYEELASGGTPSTLRFDDLDRDGNMDLAIAFGNAPARGLAVFGPVPSGTHVLDEGARAVFLPEHESDGAALCVPGDVDGDTLHDVVLITPAYGGFGTELGRAYVFLGGEF